MGWLRPTLAVLFGLLIAPAAGLAASTLLVLVDPVLRNTGYTLGVLFFQAFAEAQFDPSAAEEVRAFLAFFYTAVMVIFYFPIFLVALVGTVSRLGSFAVYGIATGIVTAAVPWLLRSAFQLPQAEAASAFEARFALALFLSGFVVGSVYWFLASTFGGSRGRSTDRRQ
jgi:glucan phosphoethanolaminetransferase (alkaline phosphatase superfamily)